MYRKFALITIIIMFIGFMLNAEAMTVSDDKLNNRPIRTAVIGGMTMTELWSKLSEMFETKTGYKVVVVATGSRPKLAEVLREGKVDLLTMHSGDITTDLVADGYGINMRPWTRNDLVIVGPPLDPAKIKGMNDGVKALAKIAQTQSPFIDFLGVGPREMCHKLWQKAGFEPKGSWVLKDESNGHLDILEFAKNHNAYMIMGRMPIVFNKISTYGMKILVEKDPQMRRPYIVMEANPERFPDANHVGARALSDFLLSQEVQSFLTTFGIEHGGIPLFYPVWPYM